MLVPMTSINLTKIREQEELSSRALVRKYEREDSEALFDFIADDNKNWPPFEISCSGVDHLNWKFWDNPIAPSVGCLAEADGRVLSFYGSTMTASPRSTSLVTSLVPLRIFPVSRAASTIS